MANSMESIRDYVSANATPANIGRRCIDGRYPLGVESGTLARPGADFGYVQIMLALNKKLSLGLSLTDCVLRVYNTITDSYGQFNIHTDQYARNELRRSEVDWYLNPLIGCAHIGLSMDPSKGGKYGLTRMEVINALYEVKMRGVKEVTLSGEHRESAILQNGGATSSINPNNGDRMYFVYDVNRDIEFMGKLLPRMALPRRVELSDFREVSDGQLTQTILNIAAGKKIHFVNADPKFKDRLPSGGAG